MRKALPWIGLSVFAATIASNMIGCSSDDSTATPGKGGSAGKGGAGGTFAGTAGGGSAGTAGKGGTAGAGGVEGGVQSRLGKACVNNDECGMGLQCITASSKSFGDAGPAKGYCTAPCTGSDAGNGCEAFGTGTICLNFGDTANPSAWCIQGCAFGPRGATQFDNTKCFGRHEVACAPLFNDLGTTCQADTDCMQGEICGNSNTCLEVFSGCLPQCNADADCGAGLFCDPSDGLCRATQKTGKVLGAQCTQSTDGGADECRGNCIGFVVSSGGQVLTTMCAENCTQGAIPSCGWGGPSSGMSADALCLFTSTVIIDQGGPGAGDRGSCGQLCNCNGDCRNPDLICRDFGSATQKQATGKQGYCSLGQEEDGGINRGIVCGASDAGPG